jgi:hypothetical protein
MRFTQRNQKTITKRNEILLLTERNEISLFILFRETSERIFCFALFRVSRNKKNDANWKP